MSVEAHPARQEALEARHRAALRSLSYSAGAWSLVLCCVGLVVLASAQEAFAQVLGAVLGVAVLVFAALSVQAARHAYRGRKSGRAVSAWAGWLALLDLAVSGLLLLIASYVLLGVLVSIG